MELHPKVKVKVIIDGQQKGSSGAWNHVPLIVISRWDAGSDEEKFEVLAAIRKTYNASEKEDIRGNERQTPSQIAQCQGFTELSYIHDYEPQTVTFIVKPLMGYSRITPPAIDLRPTL